MLALMSDQIEQQQQQQQQQQQERQQHHQIIRVAAARQRRHHMQGGVGSQPVPSLDASASTASEKQQLPWPEFYSIGGNGSACSPPDHRCLSSSSVTAAPLATANFSHAATDASRAMSAEQPRQQPPSPPLLPPKRPCRSLAGHRRLADTEGRPLCRPVPLRPASSCATAATGCSCCGVQQLVPGLESLTLQQQQQQQPPPPPPAPSLSSSSSSPPPRSRSQPAGFQLAAKRKHRDSCPCACQQQQQQLHQQHHAGRSFLVGLPTVAFATAAAAAACVDDGDEEDIEEDEDEEENEEEVEPEAGQEDAVSDLDLDQIESDL